MAIDKFPELKELTVKAPNKGIISFIASGPIEMWAPVALTGGGTGLLPTVAVTAIPNDRKVIGIAVGGSGTPVNPDGSTGTAADIAGDIVDVAVLSSGVITKARTFGTSVLIGSPLNSASGATHSLTLMPDSLAGPATFVAKALQTTTTTGDVILVSMGGSY